MEEIEYKKELYELYKEVARFAGNKGLWPLLGGQLKNLKDFVLAHPEELTYVGIEDYYIISIVAAYLKSYNNPALAEYPEYQSLKKKYLAHKEEKDKRVQM